MTLSNSRLHLNECTALTCSTPCPVLPCTALELILGGRGVAIVVSCDAEALSFNTSTTKGTLTGWCNRAAVSIPEKSRKKDVEALIKQWLLEQGVEKPVPKRGRPRKARPHSASGPASGSIAAAPGSQQDTQQRETFTPGASVTGLQPVQQQQQQQQVQASRSSSTAARAPSNRGGAAPNQAAAARYPQIESHSLPWLSESAHSTNSSDAEGISPGPEAQPITATVYGTHHRLGGERSFAQPSLHRSGCGACSTTPSSSANVNAQDGNFEATTSARSLTGAAARPALGARHDMHKRAYSASPCAAADASTATPVLLDPRRYPVVWPPAASTGDNSTWTSSSLQQKAATVATLDTVAAPATPDIAPDELAAQRERLEKSFQRESQQLGADGALHTPPALERRSQSASSASDSDVDTAQVASEQAADSKQLPSWHDQLRRRYTSTTLAKLHKSRLEAECRHLGLPFEGKRDKSELANAIAAKATDLCKHTQGWPAPGLSQQACANRSGSSQQKRAVRWRTEEPHHLHQLFQGWHPWVQIRTGADLQVHPFQHSALLKDRQFLELALPVVMLHCKPGLLRQPVCNSIKASSVPCLLCSCTPSHPGAVALPSVTCASQQACCYAEHCQHSARRAWRLRMGSAAAAAQPQHCVSFPQRPTTPRAGARWRRGVLCG